jgi:hypothetical protein
MISTDAMLSRLASGKRARARREGSAETTRPDTRTANWKNRVHHSHRHVREHTATSWPALGDVSMAAAPTPRPATVLAVSVQTILRVRAQVMGAADQRQ